MNYSAQDERRRRDTSWQETFERHLKDKSSFRYHRPNLTFLCSFRGLCGVFASWQEEEATRHLAQPSSIDMSCS